MFRRLFPPSLASSSGRRGNHSRALAAVAAVAQGGRGGGGRFIIPSGSYLACTPPLPLRRSLSTMRRRVVPRPRVLRVREAVAPKGIASEGAEAPASEDTPFLRGCALFFGSFLMATCCTMAYRGQRRHNEEVRELKSMEDEVASVDAPPGYGGLVHVVGIIELDDDEEVKEEKEQEGGGKRRCRSKKNGSAAVAVATDPLLDLAPVLREGSSRPVVLQRSVTMLQWVQHKVSSFRTGGYDDSKNAFGRVRYSQQWLSMRKNSDLYFDAATHKNPSGMPIENATFVASKLKFGAFRMSADVARQVPCSDNVYVFSNLGALLPPVRLEESVDSQVRSQFAEKTAFVRSSNEVALVTSGEVDTIGDVRLKYKMVQSGQNLYSVICHVTEYGELVAPHKFYNGRSTQRAIVYPGSLRPIDMLKKERELYDTKLHESLISYATGCILGAGLVHRSVEASWLASQYSFVRSFPKFTITLGLSCTLASMIVAKLI